MLLVFAGLFTMQSCTKESTTPIEIFKAAVPVNPTPVVDAVVPLSGTSYTLKWEGTSPTWDIYIGTTDKPGLAKAGVTGNSYVFTTTTGGEFFWYVVTKDANKVVSTSPVWNFYINSAPTAPVLTTPANNDAKFNAKGKLVWTASTDAEEDHVTYDVYLGKTATGLAIVGSNLTDATFTPTLDYATTYFWKVIAKDDHGVKTESVVFTFNTDIFRPDFSVFGGMSSEVSPSFSATAKKDVYLLANTTAKTINMIFPLADGMLGAGWGTVYSGAHPITISYDPNTLAVTSAKQLWMDSFIDPTEMGPMSVKVKSGTIDPAKKTITIVWTVSGNDYWGADYDLKATTYTMK